MSRRRTPRKRVSSTAPKDGTPLGHLSDAELVQELARRQVARRRLDLDAIEAFVEGAQSEMGEKALAATMAALPPEGSAAKPCPKCGKPVPVKTHNRVRHILTTAGELRLTRNYHYCRRCRLGFHPRDRELNLPEEGGASNPRLRRQRHLPVGSRALEHPLSHHHLLESRSPRRGPGGPTMRGGIERAVAAAGVSSLLRRASAVAGGGGRRQHAADARGVVEGSEGGRRRPRRGHHRGEESPQRVRGPLRR